MKNIFFATRDENGDGIEENAEIKRFDSFDEMFKYLIAPIPEEDRWYMAEEGLEFYPDESEFKTGFWFRHHEPLAGVWSRHYIPFSYNTLCIEKWTDTPAVVPIVPVYVLKVRNKIKKSTLIKSTLIKSTLINTIRRIF